MSGPLWEMLRLYLPVILLQKNGVMWQATAAENILPAQVIPMKLIVWAVIVIGTIT
jgi:hypothetical protein